MGKLYQINAIDQSDFREPVCAIFRFEYNGEGDPFEQVRQAIADFIWRHPSPLIRERRDLEECINWGDVLGEMQDEDWQRFGITPLPEPAILREQTVDYCEDLAWEDVAKQPAD